ncbi:putative secondary metabolism biosynthetic enzyme [Paecilomyces lecythidis]|uniref:Secondary metabolism biosynthetic enzyme n=1 Tax=Paecilomyces lecythidis TaxID=3004212 RepID=A0ABR3YBS6_9EURO
MKSTAIIQRGRAFVLEEATLPPLKEHQVYVKVEYAAFNPTDRLALDVNAFGDGALLGCDFAGTVVETHPEVTRLQTGDQIAGFVWGGETKGVGAYSMYTIADERLSFKVSHHTSAAKACSVPLAANTAWLGLFSEDCLALSRDNSTKKPPVLIWGGNSTVGYFAIQLAKLYNIEVATTCSPKSFDKARQMGATHVFDYNDPDVIPKIKSVLPNLGHVFDTIGNASTSTTAADAISNPKAVLCTVRPGKANTQNVPSHVKVTDVFVFTAFPTEHNYRNIAHWPVKMADHKLSSELHGQLESLLSNGSLIPPPVRIVGDLSPSTIEEAMDMHRQGLISGEKLIFRGLSEER